MYRKLILYLLLASVGLISACNRSKTPESTSQPIQLSTDISDTSTPIRVTLQPTATLHVTQKPTEAPDCTIASFQPTPNPTQQAVFGVVQGLDWQRGLDTAGVTIVEYSDFQ